ncbi:MAG: nucleotide exchange factor GrpE [Gammaproteobacteria bacterium]|nr:nucleotide exchange factor GrpE [Gammaproteobacteria bacterium]MCY4218532.1 nucleotide exchange factor GrpE [Gammaproteobacteria bacterium]MCY4274637.1 nucleotide exchange factor GrpE [Gammaproteobacteria bacterium]
MSNSTNKIKQPVSEESQTELQDSEKSQTGPLDLDNTVSSEQQNAPADQDDSIEESDSETNESNTPQEMEMMSPDQLLVELTTTRAEANKLKDGYLRAKADVENIQRRSQNEISSARKYAIEGFAKELLSVADSLDQAVKVEIDDSANEAVEKMHEGLALTLKQLESVFDKFDISSVEADQGVPFNPEYHQAISMVDSEDVKSGEIVSVMQKGFILKDRLLRPAMVIIAN